MADKNPLRYSILASGSTGNVTYLETDQHRILIDAGLSGKKIEGLMAKIDRYPRTQRPLSRGWGPGTALRDGGLR